MFINKIAGIFLLAITLFVGACSGSGQKSVQNSQEKTADGSLFVPNAAHSATIQGQSQPPDTTEGSFTFQINGRKHTAAKISPAMYSDINDTSRVLGIVGTESKTKGQGIVITINLQLGKEELKPGTYTIGDAGVDSTRCKVTIMKKTEKGFMYLGKSTKGILTITKFKEDQEDQYHDSYSDVSIGTGHISGHLSFQGTILLMTTMADDPSEKPLTVKGTFKNVTLTVSHHSPE